MPRIRALLFDWGNTLMFDEGQEKGPMCQWPKVRSCPHARVALRKLSGEFLTALATNAEDSHAEEIREALKRVRMNAYIRHIYCSNDIGARKPSLQFYRHIAQDLSLSPHEMVMIGDHLQNDILGALHAGMRALWYCPRPEVTETRYLGRRFGDFRELPSMLKEMESGPARSGSG